MNKELKMKVLDRLFPKTASKGGNVGTAISLAGCAGTAVSSILAVKNLAVIISSLILKETGDELLSHFTDFYKWWIIAASFVAATAIWLRIKPESAKDKGSQRPTYIDYWQRPPEGKQRGY